MAKIAIVDDESGQRTIIRSILSKAGHEVREADGIDSGLALAEEWLPDVVLSDYKMGNRTGLELLENILKLPQAPEVVIMTAYGSVETAVKAMKLGAYDYLSKPIEREELLMTTERASERHLLRLDGSRVRESARKQLYDGMVSESTAMKEIFSTVEKVAPTDATILIRGESGTGKERIAKLIHYLSPRTNRPMQSINCSAFPESLLESELFGYEKGAFTGANGRKLGIIEAAHGSTLFLDEVADTSLGTQAKLLRVLQEKEIRRLGSTSTIKVDIRIISATNKSLEDSIKKGFFREDLFYRLNIIPITVPALRNRKDDIPALIAYFLQRRGGQKSVDPQAIKMLCSYNWPGNVRELEAVMERTIILSSGNVITVSDLPSEIRLPVVSASGSTVFEIPSNGLVFEDFEKELLIQALTKSNGLMTEASKLLGMSYRTFQYRAMKFGILDKNYEL